MTLMRKTFLTLADNNALYKLIVGNPVTRAMTRRFVAGEKLDEALAAVRELNGAGIKGSLDLLGENVHTEDEARQAGAFYETIVDRIAEAGLDTNVSLKLTQMGLDLSEDLCFEVTSGVVKRAAQHGNFVRIDMEGSAYTERTLAMFKRLHAAHGKHVGIVLQAYLYRTAEDVEEMIRLGARVRLCKGAYLEPAEVAFADKAEVDRNYVACMKRLMEAGYYPGLATHDMAIIEAGKAHAKAQGIGLERFEFQMLYGIRRDMQESLVKEGYTMRCYVPFGTQWYPYFMRRLAERPANVWFLLHNAVKG
ncbi:MAG: proline dehydrogenase family protein [Candidatus Sericytochromatia bacterium]|nr:proline dehydrogenase family protein [Candidatus Sericytochromatia bacterium]